MNTKKLFTLLIIFILLCSFVSAECITIGYGSNTDKLTCAYIEESHPNDNNCCYLNPPIYEDDDRDEDEDSMVEFDFGFYLDSINIYSATLSFYVRGNGDDGYAKFSSSTAAFDPHTVTYSTKPISSYMWTSEYVSSSGDKIESTTDLNLIKNGFHGKGAYYRIYGDADSDEECDLELVCASNRETYLQICYTGTPRVCNPSEPCCSSDGYSYKPSGTGCSPIENAICDTADMSTCNGHAYQDQCTGSSSDCPNNNVEIDYDAACSGIDVGVCAKCTGGSNPTLDPDHDDCEPYDCDPLDNDCRDYSDVQQCIGIGSCANQDNYCTIFTNQPSGTNCGICGNCDGSGNCIGDHEIICNYDVDCTDADPYTRDICMLPGTCEAYCINGLWCGNEQCDNNENSSSCPIDCPTVCGDGACEGLENCYNCESDCGECQGDVLELVYDENGNLIQDAQYYYEFNSLNQLTKVKQGNQNGRVIAEYFYDELGERVKKVEFTDNGDITTYYIGNFVRVVDGSNISDTIYYYNNGQLIATKNNDGSKYYYHPDHLGSTNIITDENGDLIEETTYMPFGEVIEGGSSRYLFTGQEKDQETSLMYYGARYYSPFLKRFTQPDTIIQNVYDPQSLNRYSYVRNNPLKYTDPEGHLLHIPLGAAIGATIWAGASMVTQIWNGASLFDGSMDWKEVGKSALTGAAAGATAAATFGLGTYAYGTGWAGTLAAGSMAGLTGGTSAQLASNALNDRPLTENVFNVEERARDALIGAASAGIGKGLSSLKSAASQHISKNSLYTSGTPSSKGYSYLDRASGLETMRTGTIPNSGKQIYGSFDKYSQSSVAHSRLQIPKQNKVFRAEFPTSQFSKGGLEVPTVDGYLDPYTISNPQWGSGGGSQFIIQEDIVNVVVRPLR